MAEIPGDYGLSIKSCLPTANTRVVATVCEMLLLEGTSRAKLLEILV